MANTTRMLRFHVGATTLFLLGLTTACTTDDSDPGEDSGGSSGTGTGGSTSGTGGATGGSSTGGSSGTGGGKATKCAAPITLASTATGIADFDNYSANADLQTWSFPLGGDAASGILSGTFVYGDDHMESGKEVPEAFAMVAGNDSTYALSISDTQAE